MHFAKKLVYEVNCLHMIKRTEYLVMHLVFELVFLSVFLLSSETTLNRET